MFLSPSLNLHLSIYLSKYLSLTHILWLPHNQSTPCRQAASTDGGSSPYSRGIHVSIIKEILWERTHSHSSQSLSLFIDVCGRRKQSLTVFLSPSLNLHLCTYPLRAFCTFTLDSCASACVPKKTKFAAVAPSALSTPGVWRLSIFQGLVGDCVWERIVRGEGERRNHYIYIYIYINIYIHVNKICIMC